MDYRIEKRSDTGQPTMYWSHFMDAFAPHHWTISKAYARVYSEAERKESLNRVLRGEASEFPAGGVWVVLDRACACEHHKRVPVHAEVTV